MEFAVSANVPNAPITSWIPTRDFPSKDLPIKDIRASASIKAFSQSKRVVGSWSNKREKSSRAVVSLSK